MASPFEFCICDGVNTEFCPFHDKRSQMKQIKDNDMGLLELIEKCSRIAREHGWNDKPIIFSDAIVLMHSELSEVYEEYRNNHGTNEVYVNLTEPNKNKPEGIPIELADLAIRLFHYVDYFGIDLLEAIKGKMAYNETRPYRHGGKKS